MHTCTIHTCIHAYMHTCIHAYMHTCIHAYMHTCIHVHTCTYMYVQYVYIYIFVCIYVCIWIHAYIIQIILISMFARERKTIHEFTESVSSNKYLSIGEVIIGFATLAFERVLTTSIKLGLGRTSVCCSYITRNLFITVDQRQANHPFDGHRIEIETIIPRGRVLARLAMDNLSMSNKCHQRVGSNRVDSVLCF